MGKEVGIYSPLEMKNRRPAHWQVSQKKKKKKDQPNFTSADLSKLVNSYLIQQIHSVVIAKVNFAFKVAYLTQYRLGSFGTL